MCYVIFLNTKVEVTTILKELYKLYRCSFIVLEVEMYTVTEKNLTIVANCNYCIELIEKRK